MTAGGFSPEQQEYLKGFMSGVEARRGTLVPTTDSGTGTAPADAMRAAQDATVARGGKLTPEEKAKRERHPLDRWDEVTDRAAQHQFPHGVHNLLTRWHGLFYVGPTQDSFMCRLRLPGGIVTAQQLHGVADIARSCGGGFADVTTRANLQLREIPAASGPEVIERLADLGILAKGTGADNIRNITASPTAGIDAAELIDTRPLLRTLHHHILNSRDLFGLPRKFNIALDGGGAVAVLEDTNDIALTAVRTPDGEIVFRLGLGGITGHRDFARATGVVVPPAGVVRVCDAILRAYIANGDRTDRRRARLKYLLDDWGLPRFLEDVEARLGASLRRAETVAPAPPVKHGHLGVHDQRQPGLQYIGILLPVGRVTVERLHGLADIASRFGSGDLRLTVWQNLLIPDIAHDRMPGAQAAIAALGLGWEASHVRGGLVACTGNAGCKFAAANTKRHAQELTDFLEPRITLPRPINIHLTGCHHSCAQHYVADIGLLAAKVERGDDEVEGYDLHVGGGAGPEQSIGRLILPKVAHDVLGPAVLALLRAWRDAAPDVTFQDFCTARDDAALRALAEAGAAWTG